jgi:CheY-like chemotaxis protein
MNSGDLYELSGRTLLVVEDDDDIVDVLATVLGRYGVQLVRVRTVGEAIAHTKGASIKGASIQRGESDPIRSRHLYLKTARRSLLHWGRKAELALMKLVRPVDP